MYLFQILLHDLKYNNNQLKVVSILKLAPFFQTGHLSFGQRKLNKGI